MLDALVRLIEVAGYGLLTLILLGAIALVVGFVLFLRSFT